MKRTNYPALLLTIGCLAATAAHAQVSFSVAPRLGLNVSTVSLNGSNLYDVQPRFGSGVEAGVLLDARSGNFAVQPSLLFSQKGFKLDETRTQNDGNEVYDINAKATITLNYLQLPINFVYTSGGTEGFQFFAGPYLGVLLGGSTDVSLVVKEKATGADAYRDSSTGTIKSGDKQPNENTSAIGSSQNPNSTGKNVLYVRGFDAGLQGGVGYRYKMLQAQASYQIGFSNLVPADAKGQDVGYTAKNRGFTLSVGYLFGKGN